MSSIVTCPTMYIVTYFFKVPREYIKEIVTTNDSELPEVLKKMDGKIK